VDGQAPCAVILCGGRGMRAYPLTETLPKPLLPVSGRPVLEHVMELYARRGVTRFVLALGYLGDRIVDHFGGRADWDIDFVDTGLETGTGERVRRCAPRAGGRFFCTYADGLGDVDLDALLRAHAESGAEATVTTVPLPSPYGTLDIDATGRVRGFREKPRLVDHWINAGFFVFEPQVFTRIGGEDLEREVLPALAAEGTLNAHRHTGFWHSLDTYKHLQELEALAAEGPRPPWW
jgi:glucose-1-phosphate cytidylyltransferase